MTKQKGEGGRSLKIENIKTESLVPYARNSRTHTPDQVLQVSRSIGEFGFTNPVLIDSDNGIIAGHCRVLAAGELGLEFVPCIRLGHLTDGQKKAYVIADNRLAENAGWNAEMLKLEVTDLSSADFDLSLLGFDESELSEILDIEQEVKDVEPRLDEAEELQEKWGTELGQVWSLGEHRLMCGNSESAPEVSRLLNGASPQIMVTDPPYGVNYDPSWRNDAGISNSARTGIVENDDRADWTDAWRLFGGAVAYVWHGGLHSATVQESLVDAGFQVRGQIVWVKPRLVLSRGHYHWQHEPCWVATSEDQPEDDNPDCDLAWYAVRKNSTAKWDGGRKQTTVWQIGLSDEVTTVHGTQKPIECMARPIRNHACSVDGVYEPFSGSGTTIMACEITNRKCYAMELSPKYVAVALQRYVDSTGKGPVLTKD